MWRSLIQISQFPTQQKLNKIISGFYLNDAEECVAAENCQMNLCEEYPDVCGDFGTCIGTDVMGLLIDYK